MGVWSVIGFRPLDKVIPASRCLPVTESYIRAHRIGTVMLRIAIVGPESSGKTVLTEALAAHYRAVGVREPSRTYLEALDRPYEEHDLLAIAHVLEQQHAAPALDTCDEHTTVFVPHTDPRCRPIFYDTDTLNIRIWSEEKYGRVHPGIERSVHGVRYHWRLLCRPDILWEPDPLRENPHDRDRLFAVWERELKSRDLHYTIVEGTHHERMRTALARVDLLRAECLAR